MSKDIFKSSLFGQAFRYLLVGGLNTGVTYGLYVLLLAWLGYQLAYVVSYIIGIALSYLLNAKAVFRVQTSLVKACLFSMIYLLQLGGGALLMYLLVGKLKVPDKLAPLAVLCITVPISFFLVRKVMKLT